ncbi:unnamed protein product [Rotaria sordida]|uniref:Uncharacterized protein n=1 Tax=Rotaria sordida TaxID=392033 RepID=A0A814ZX33_9BILA|nr:unnamed protein product [Rotaria sordida]CAF1248817.1 unnamed protein product [Rotaria sordida]CAF1530230.1 unnamed protein product [Rotaria sordida]CAF1530291.1 unnamed protein product [Rotaria sordida]
MIFSKKILNLAPTYPSSLLSAALDLIKHFLEKEPTQRFTYVAEDSLSHIASRSVLSMTLSSVACSQSNIYLVDPDYYHKHQNIHNLPTQYSVSTINIPSMAIDASSSVLKIAIKIYEQQLMNERLICIQRMMTSGQNIASIFNDYPHFAQQIMSYMAATQQGPDVIEIMGE